ncbi:MAG: DUF3298 domain-containing protein [Candidatus Pacebacteria bacterium]|nr:DUF3298 domain-containing protein [Candidatus Paceibacterota bacterium]
MKNATGSKTALLIAIAVLIVAGGALAYGLLHRQGANTPTYIMRTGNRTSTLMTASTDYPEISGLSDRKIQDKVNEGIREVAALPAEPDRRSEFQSRATISEMTSRYLSILFDVYEYTAGEAHPNRYGETLTYDLETGNALFLRDFFKPDSDYLSVLSQKTRNDLADQMKIEETNDMLDAGTAPNESNFSRFVLTDKGLLFFFGNYSVASYAAGEFQSLIPYGDLSDILDPEFASRIGTFAPSPLL